MAIELLVQKSIKISYSNDKEFNEELKKLSRAVGDLRIEHCTPESTDTKQWRIVYYWSRE